jgi:MFS family permease
VALRPRRQLGARRAGDHDRQQRRPEPDRKATPNLSASAVADIATWYLIGEVIGALFFGMLSDKLGRRNPFMVTLGVYLIGSGMTAARSADGKSSSARTCPATS